MAVTALLLPNTRNKLPNQRDTTPDDGECWRDAGTKLNATMARAGQATIDFGAIPGASDTNLAVTGQDDIAAGASVEAFIIPTATVDHSADEHVVDPPRVCAGNVVAGTGFTIYANYPGPMLAYGKWTVGWRWSPNV
jgi:hypothetical protein